MTVDPYAVLGVAPTATLAEITHAYRRRLRAHHPDLRSPESGAAADEQLPRILAAYALLRDPARRTSYDRAHPIHHDTGPIRVKVNHRDPAGDEPAIRAGPVRWQR